MSKGDDASKLGHGTAGRELTEVDLGAVSGDFFAVEHSEIGCPNCEAAATAAINALRRMLSGGW
jgi:hypothetical protein